MSCQSFDFQGGLWIGEADMKCQIVSPPGTRSQVLGDALELGGHSHFVSVCKHVTRRA